MKLSTKLLIGAGVILTGTFLTHVMARDEKPVTRSPSPAEDEKEKPTSTPTAKPATVTKMFSLRITDNDGNQYHVVEDIVIRKVNGNYDFTVPNFSFSIAEKHPEDIESIKKLIHEVKLNILAQACSEQGLEGHLIDEIKEFSNCYVVEITVK